MSGQPAPADDSASRNDPVLSTLLAECPELAEVVEEFVRGLPKRIQSMEDALRAQAFEDVARTAHQLKGAGGSHGYAAITVKAGAIEHAARSRIVDDLEDKLAELAALIERVRCGLKHGQERPT